MKNKIQIFFLNYWPFIFKKISNLAQFNLFSKNAVTRILCLTFKHDYATHHT